MEDIPKHTPGPWRVKERLAGCAHCAKDGVRTISIVGSDGTVILCNGPHDDGFGPDKGEDVALITAAPELLALLKEFWPVAQAHIEEYAPGRYEPDTARVEAVIAKAEGRSGEK